MQDLIPNLFKYAALAVFLVFLIGDVTHFVLQYLHEGRKKSSTLSYKCIGSHEGSENEVGYNVYLCVLTTVCPPLILLLFSKVSEWVIERGYDTFIGSILLGTALSVLVLILSKKIISLDYKLKLHTEEKDSHDKL